MTVEQLIEQLRRLPPDTVVVMWTEEKDAFTTEISVVAGAYFQYTTNTTGIIHYEDDTPERILANIRNVAKPCCFIEALG